MDQVPLVEEQIKDGQRLAERLAGDGFGVTAACWIKASEDGQWFLYIASPFVNGEGYLKGYRRVHALMREMPQPFRIDLLEVKLIGAADPITKDVVALRDRYPGKSPIRFRGSRLGDLAIEEAYIYPPAAASSGVA